MGILADRFPRSRTGTSGFWITDGGKAMINATENKFLNLKRQRSVKHKMENILGYIPTEQYDQVYQVLRAIFYQDNLEKAEQTATAFLLKYEQIYPTTCDCLRRDLNECITFYLFPQKH